MQTFTFDISGMTCGGCTSNVRQTVAKLDGVSDVEVALHPGIATATVDPSRVTPAQIEAAIKAIGFSAKLRAA